MGKSRHQQIEAQNAQLEQKIAGSVQLEETLRYRGTILEAIRSAAVQFSKANSWEEHIERVLAQLGQAAGVSRVYIFENHRGKGGRLLTSQRYEWVALGIVPQIENPELQGFDWLGGGFGRWVEILRHGDPICGHVREFPASEREVLGGQDIRSIAVVLIFVEGSWWGFIGFDACLAEREWMSILPLWNGGS